VSAQDAGFVEQQPATAVAQQPKPTVAITTPKPSWPGAAYGFSIVLVLGDVQGGATADNVPPAARKALADMKDFLPYKSYRLLDSAWVLGSGNVSTRLRGPDEQEYALNLSGGSSREDPKTLHISFQLRDASQVDDIGVKKFAAPGEPVAVARTRERISAAELRAKLEQQIHDLTVSHGANHPDVLKAKAELDQLNRQLAELGAKAGAPFKESRSGACCIISTGFTMEIGETVVVGTSRLRGGDKALIALLTAVPRAK
jgi:hypothetical protein